MPDSKSPNCKDYGCKDSNAGQPESSEEVECKPETERQLGIRDFLKEQETPYLIRKFGAPQKQMLRTCLPALGLYSLAALIMTVFICEWKPVVRWIPFYNTKFEDNGKGSAKKKKKKKKNQNGQ